MAKLNLNTAEQLREQITAEQQKQIEAMYKKVSRRVAAQAKKAPKVPSDRLRQHYLNELQKQLDAQLKNLGQDLESTIKDNMGLVSQSVCDANLDFLTQAGMPIAGAFSHVPDEIIRAIATGTVYEGNWSLSTSIWRGTRKAQEDIRSIIAAGVAENRSAYDIAKDLEKYVNPAARKEWDWNKVYPGTAKKVDYNAQRLARTMVSHAYQQSFVRTTQKNPFVTEYIWLASNSDRTCDICAERDGKHFPKDDLPMDHPNGMCTFEAVIPDEMTDIADRLADWAHGKDDSELEDWAKALYGDNWRSPPHNQESYKYHATKRTSIPGIIEKGLKPNRGHLGHGVYFAPNTEDALWWTAETSTGGTTLLRVSEDFLKSLGYEEYTAKESGYGVAEGLVDAKIPFDKIEVKVGDEWWSLTQYAEQYKVSVYNNLSSTAQRKVDKEFARETREWLEKRAKKG